jgi:hypothetical protein
MFCEKCVFGWFWSIFGGWRGITVARAVWACGILSGSWLTKRILIIGVGVPAYGSFLIFSRPTQEKVKSVTYDHNRPRRQYECLPSGYAG